jgi:hypothetical protein
MTPRAQLTGVREQDDADAHEIHYRPLGSS